MTIWEYDCVKAPRDVMGKVIIYIPIDTLNKYGSEGWELVSVEWEQNEISCAIFKREERYITEDLTELEIHL